MVRSWITLFPSRLNRAIILFLIFLPNGCSDDYKDNIPRDISFSSQEELDKWAEKYPSVISLDRVHISGEDITDLRGLRQLNYIEELVITENPELTNLSGFDYLRHVRNVVISNNPRLQSLGKLGEIRNNLEIRENQELPDLSGIDYMEFIGGDLQIINNRNLKSLQGLNNIRSIGQKLIITDNPSLVDISGLNNLRSVGSDLHIENNPELSSCNGISICSLLSCSGDRFNIENNGLECSNVEELRLKCDSVRNKELSSDTTIRVRVLESIHYNYPEFWNYLNANSSEFGDTKIQIIDVDYFFYYPEITCEELERQAPDVIILDNAQSLTEDEINVVKDYVRKGNGLIVTGGSLRVESNQEILDLLGLKYSMGSRTYFETSMVDSIEILDPAHEIFCNLPVYKTSSRRIYSGGHGDYSGIVKTPNCEIVALIWNISNERGVLTSFISCNENTDYKAVFVGHSPAGPDPSQDDYRFFYNLLVYVAETKD